MRRLGLMIAIAIVAAAGAPAGAQQTDSRAAAREIVRKWQDAIVNVRVVLKTRVSMGGREVQSSDESVDLVATLIDPSGLTVLSLNALNPGAMMNKLMAGMGGGGGGEQPQFVSEPTDVKIRLADGRELPAKIVLRDEDLDLAFLRPLTKPDKPLAAIDLSTGARPALLEEVVVLSRLGRVGGWVASASLNDVGAIIEKPRTFFVIAGAPSGMGIPAFQTGGRVIGLLTMRQVEAGRSNMMGMIGGSLEGLGLLPVILPAADVLEVAKQAIEK